MGLYCIHHFWDLFNVCLSTRAVTNGRTCGPTPLHTFTCNVAIKYVYTILLIQHLFGNTFSTRLAMTVRFCTVFTLSKTYSASICHRHFHKTYRDCCGLHYVYPFKHLFNNFLSATFPYDLSWLLGSALYSTFQRIIQHLFVRNISIRLAMTVGVCTVFTFQRLIQRLFINIISTRLTMTAVRSALYSSLKDLLNICLSPTFVTNISTRLAMTVGICTVFILPKTYSTSVCQHFLHKTYHDCWGLYCIHPFQDVFSICLPPTLPQDLP